MCKNANASEYCECMGVCLVCVWCVCVYGVCVPAVCVSGVCVALAAQATATFVALRLAHSLTVTLPLLPLPVSPPSLPTPLSTPIQLLSAAKCLAYLVALLGPLDAKNSLRSLSLAQARTAT